jgi:hypothetical protein
MVASTNTTDLGYILESTPGTTPATPAFQLLPVVGNELIDEISTAVSEAIRSDRQTDDLIIVDADVTGSIPFELTYTAWQPLMEALLQGVTDTGTPGERTTQNGVEVPDSFTFQKTVNVAGTPYYYNFRGAQVGAMTFNFETGSILTASMDIVARSAEGTATAITGQSNTPIADYTLMNSVTSASIAVTGLPVTTEFNSMALTINNNINQAKAIGTLGAVDLASFTLEITGDIEIYFEDLSAYNLFKAASEFSVVITLTDGAGNIIDITLPKCKFESLSGPIPGKDEFLFQTGSFRALRDTADYMVEFKFTDA